jgi:hypothetical protein
MCVHSLKLIYNTLSIPRSRELRKTTRQLHKPAQDMRSTACLYSWHNIVCSTSAQLCSTSVIIRGSGVTYAAVIQHTMPGQACQDQTIQVPHPCKLELRPAVQPYNAQSVVNRAGRPHATCLQSHTCHHAHISIKNLQPGVPQVPLNPSLDSSPDSELAFWQNGSDTTAIRSPTPHQHNTSLRPAASATAGASQSTLDSSQLTSQHTVQFKHKHHPIIHTAPTQHHHHYTCFRPGSLRI